MNVMFFVQPGTNSRSTLLDLMKGFERAGHRVWHWDLGPMWGAQARAGNDAALKNRLLSEFTQMVRATMEFNRIDLSVGMWANALTSLMGAGVSDGSAGVRAASVFEVMKRPHLCYWLDAPHWAAEGATLEMLSSPGGEMLRSEWIHHAINNGATAEEMRAVLGLKNVTAQHYGIDEEVFGPRGEGEEFDIVFGLGPGDPPPTRLMLGEVESDEPDVAAIRHEAMERARPGVMAVARRAAGAATGAVEAAAEELLRTQVMDRHTPMLERWRRIGSRGGEIGAAVAAVMRDPRRFVDLTMAVRQGVEGWERAFVLTYLSRRFKVATFGPGGDQLAAWGLRATHLGTLKWEDQSAAYSRGRVGLNVMRWQDDAGLNVKPYEITGSGTACVCARRGGIEALFEPGREIAVFEGAAEAARVVRSLIENRAEREAMRQAGRARTLRDYTWTAVARDLAATIAGP